MTLRLVCAFVLLAAGLNVEPDQEAPRRLKLLPRDEAVQVPAFKTYRDAMQAAVAARDADRVLPMIHPEIRKVFEHTLRLTAKALGGTEHQDWTALEKLLKLGGTFTTGLNRVRNAGQRQHATREFCAPYVWSAYPRRPFPPHLLAEDDPWVVLGSSVAVRAKPPHDMRVLTRLGYDLVLLENAADVNAGAPKGWIGIVTPDGRRGYVADHLIRDRFDYHACFGEFDGQWLMTEFARF